MPGALPISPLGVRFFARSKRECSGQGKHHSHYELSIRVARKKTENHNPKHWSRKESRRPAIDLGFGESLSITKSPDGSGIRIFDLFVVIDA